MGVPPLMFYCFLIAYPPTPFPFSLSLSLSLYLSIYLSLSLPIAHISFGLSSPMSSSSSPSSPPPPPPSPLRSYFFELAHDSYSLFSLSDVGRSGRQAESCLYVVEEIYIAVFAISSFASSGLGCLRYIFHTLLCFNPR